MKPITYLIIVACSGLLAGCAATMPPMELLDALGGRTVLRFPEFRPGAPVEPSAFRFTPPKGVDVIGQ